MGSGTGWRETGGQGNDYKGIKGSGSNRVNWGRAVTER